MAEHRKLKLEELNRLSIEAFKSAEKQGIVVVLDDVRSMNNVGAVFRSADAFGIAQLYLCGITPAPPHREIHKTALGAEESVAWTHCPDIHALLNQLKSQGYLLAAVEQTENSLSLPDLQLEARQQIAIILGNEVEGVQQSVIDASDVVLEIPQFGTKHSLNISVAAGIVMYEVRKRIG